MTKNDWDDLSHGSQVGKRHLFFSDIVGSRMRSRRSQALVLLALVSGALTGISAGCRNSSRSALSLHLLPDPATCAGVPVTCVDTLHVNLLAAGNPAPIIDHDDPFQVPGAHI